MVVVTHRARKERAKRNGRLADAIQEGSVEVWENGPGLLGNFFWLSCLVGLLGLVTRDSLHAVAE